MDNKTQPEYVRYGVRSDTTDEAARIQREIMMSKTPEERLKIGFDMNKFVYEIVRSGVIWEHPEYDEGEIRAAIFERYYGNELAPKFLEYVKGELIKEHRKKENSVDYDK